jgi:hypothetical protein
MPPSKPTTVKQYLDALPADRRTALNAVRKVIRANIGKEFKEGIQYGMVGYYLPHSVYPAGYHCDPSQPLPFASLASQKNHMAIYLFCVYTDDAERERFIAEWKKTGKKLDMGASCVRFKSIDDVPLDVVGRAIKRMTVKKFIAAYETIIPANKRTPGANKTTKKNTTKKKSVRKKTARKSASKKTAKRVAKKTTRKTAKKRSRR